MKNFNKTIYSSLLFTVFFAANLLNQAAATTVNVMPASTTVNTSSSFTVSLMGSGFSNTTGFGLDLNWDSSLIQLVSAIVDSASWEFTTSNNTGLEPNIDNISGSISGLGGSSFQGRSGDVKLADLTFESFANIGTSALNLSVSSNPTWLWADISGVVTPTLNNAEITVVPVPAAFWFASFGLASLGFFRRKSNLA